MRIKEIRTEQEENNYFLENRVNELENETEILKQTIRKLERRNQKLQKENGELIFENMKRIEESNRLFGEKIDLEYELETIKDMGMFEFADKYCNDTELEEAGHMMAKDLLGGE